MSIFHSLLRRKPFVFGLIRVLAELWSLFCVSLKPASSSRQSPPYLANEMAEFKGASADEAYSSSSPGPGADADREAARGDHEAIDPGSGVKRGLKTRHLSMLALAGIVSIR